METQVSREILQEIIWKTGHAADFKGSPMLNSDQNDHQRSQNAHAWKTVVSGPIADAVLELLKVPIPEANSGSIPIDYAAWIRDWLSKHKLPANDYYTPDMLREFHAAIVTNSGSIKRGEDGSITQKMRGRPVTQKEAMESAQRLINSHFNNPDRARMQIPVSAADDDVIVTDYIREQPAVSEGIATQECAICGRPAHGDFPRKPVVSEGKPEPASINQEMQEAAKLLVEAMETCHICKGLLVLQKNPAHCEDCSRDCEGHEGSECTPIYELHRILKAVLAKADSMGGK